MSDLTELKADSDFLPWIAVTDALDWKTQFEWGALPLTYLGLDA